MGYLINYLIAEEVETSGEIKEIEIIENPQGLKKGDVCHDVEGNAWGISHILDPKNGQSFDETEDDSPISSFDLATIGAFENANQGKVFILEGIDPVGVTKTEISGPDQPKKSESAKGGRRT